MAGTWSLRQLFAGTRRAPVKNTERVATTGIIEAGDFLIDTVERIATLQGQSCN
jgi:hypothetical protein